MLKKALQGILAVAVVGAMSTLAPAATVTTFTSSSLGNSGNGNAPVFGTVSFTVTAGHLQIDLTNLELNPISAGSLLGGVTFTLSGSGLGSPANITRSGTLIDVSGSTRVASPYAGNATTELAHWVFTNLSPDTFQVNTNDPLIIGYGVGGLATSPYSAANASLVGGGGAQHQPFIQHSGSFGMDISGLTESMTFSNVSLLWGTGFSAFSTTNTTGGGSGTPPGTPLPSAVWGGASLMAAVGLGSRLRRKMKQA